MTLWQQKMYTGFADLNLRLWKQHKPDNNLHVPLTHDLIWSDSMWACDLRVVKQQVCELHVEQSTSCNSTESVSCYLWLNENVSSSVIWQKGKSQKQLTSVCLSGGKKRSFFGKFGVLCIPDTSILRFALLPYYRRVASRINLHVISRPQMRRSESNNRL